MVAGFWRFNRNIWLSDILSLNIKIALNGAKATDFIVIIFKINSNLKLVENR